MTQGGTFPATLVALAVAVSSFLVSAVVAGRDRARLAIRVRPGLTTPGLEEALVVQVANVGRRPLGLDPAVQLLLEGGGGMVAADPAWYHDAPADQVLAEARSYLVAIPRAAWRECRAPGPDGGGGRCVAVGVTDSRGRWHKRRLPRDLAAWFNR